MSRYERNNEHGEGYSRISFGRMLAILAGSFLALLLVLAALVVGFGSWGTVEAGHRGVVLSMGAVTGEIKPEGFYTKWPWVETVVEMDVRQQKVEVLTECASRDLQVVDATIALNLSVIPDECANIYQDIGMDYMTKVVDPAMQESFKAVVARYTAEELITKREMVREEIARLVESKLKVLGMHTDAVNIVNFKFSASFNAAIEAKVTAEQNALAAKNLLAQKEFEAQQAVATARGKAEAMEIEAAALANNPQVLQLRALERWDGKMPLVTSGALPFIDIGKLTQQEEKRK